MPEYPDVLALYPATARMARLRSAPRVLLADRKHNHPKFVRTNIDVVLEEALEWLQSRCRPAGA
jgi:hypothetical protein